MIIQVEPGKPGRKFQNEKNHKPKKEFAYRMCEGDQPVRCQHRGFLWWCAVVVTWPVLMSWGWLRGGMKYCGWLSGDVRRGNVASCKMSCHVTWCNVSYELVMRFGWLWGHVWLKVAVRWGNWRLMWWPVLQGTLQRYKSLQRAAPYCKPSLRTNPYYKVLQGRSKQLFSVLQSITGRHKVLRRSTENYKALYPAWLSQRMKRPVQRAEQQKSSSNITKKMRLQLKWLSWLSHEKMKLLTDPVTLSALCRAKSLWRHVCSKPISCGFRRSTILLCPSPTNKPSMRFMGPVRQGCGIRLCDRATSNVLYSSLTRWDVELLTAVGQ